MMVDMASAATALLVFLAIWLAPVVAFTFTTRLRGLERLNWALFITVLSWPAFGLYLLFVGLRNRHS